MILSTSLFLKASTAMATARYVLPVPAGPTPKTSSYSFRAWTYFFWPRVLHLICLPRAVRATTSPMISEIRSAFPSLARSTAYRMRLRLMGSPLRCMDRSFSRTVLQRAAFSASPSMPMPSPFTVMRVPVSCSKTEMFSSRTPNRPAASSMLSSSIRSVLISMKSLRYLLCVSDIFLCGHRADAVQLPALFHGVAIDHDDLRPPGHLQ